MNRNIWITIIYNILVFSLNTRIRRRNWTFLGNATEKQHYFYWRAYILNHATENRQLTQTSEKKETFESYNIEPNVYIWTAHIFKKEKFDLLQIIYIGHFLCLIVIHYKPIMAHGRFLHTTLSPMIPNHN